MNSIFTIQGKKYIASSLWDATQQVIDEARDLLRAGKSERSRELYEEARRLRQGMQKEPLRHSRSQRLALFSPLYRAIS